jgi:hypothetical protein
MALRAWALAVLLVATGCTQTIDSPRPVAAPRVAPIGELQVHELLSEQARDGGDGNLFGTVRPDRCSPIVREVDPPLIVDFGPAATDGGHWNAEQSGVLIEEMAGVYPSDFDPNAALAKAREVLQGCRDVEISVTTIRDDSYVFRLLPQRDSGSDNIVHWSLRGTGWACDNAYVAAHNAAVGIAACAPVGGYDVLSPARDALERINTLANMTA